MRISDCSSDVCSSDLTVCTWAVKKVRRPVKWTAERSESFSSDAHGRDHVTHAELAMDENGKFLGLKVETDRKSTRLNPVTTANIVCRLLLEKKKLTIIFIRQTPRLLVYTLFTQQTLN